MASQRWTLDGQRALVTGASAGIGLAICRELLGFGAQVLMVARDAALLDARAPTSRTNSPAGGCGAGAGGRTSPTRSSATRSSTGRPTGGLHIPGQQRRRQPHPPGAGLRRGPVARDLRDQSLFRVRLCRGAHPLLAKHAASAIVNIGSVSGETHVRSGAPYGMSKAALHQMTRNLAVEWAEDGVRVNSVAPWYIRTRRTSGKLSDPDYLDEVCCCTPLGRIGEPEEVAAAVAFCACRRPATSPANASRWTADSCVTASEPVPAPPANNFLAFTFASDRIERRPAFAAGVVAGVLHTKSASSSRRSQKSKNVGGDRRTWSSASRRRCRHRRLAAPSMPVSPGVRSALGVAVSPR